MNPKKLSNDLDARLGVSRAMQAVLVTFMLSTVLLSLALLLHRDEERVVMLPPQIAGDCLALINAGAYSSSMSSNHCMRGEFTERLI